MRYKVKADSIETFHQAKSMVADEAKIFVSSEGRLSLSTSDLPARLRAKLAALGARVAPDMQYHADVA